MIFDKDRPELVLVDYLISVIKEYQEAQYPESPVKANLRIGPAVTQLSINYTITAKEEHQNNPDIPAWLRSPSNITHFMTVTATSITIRRDTHDYSDPDSIPKIIEEIKLTLDRAHTGYHQSLTNYVSIQKPTEPQNS